MFSAISSADIFSLLLHLIHFSLFQISSLVVNPMITTSLSKPANYLRLFAIKNLPCLSISHSVAPAKKNLVKSLAFLLEIGSAFNFPSNISHSVKEYTNKHPSNPFVTTNFSPSSSLSLDGMISLPF